MRLILDTNILISALIPVGGLANRLWEAWRITRFTLITSDEQFEEFRRVTRYPRLQAHVRPADAGTMLNELRDRAIVLTNLPRWRYQVIPTITSYCPWPATRQPLARG